MFLTQYYHTFIRLFIDQIYFQQYDDVIVLGERFVGRYYIIIFIAIENGIKTHYMLIENVKKPNLIELQALTLNPKYIVYATQWFKVQLKNNHLYKKLVNMGLYRSLESGLKKDSIFSQHRLIMCLYQNIIGWDVHHISKDKKQNEIGNLVRLFHKRNVWIDNLPIEATEIGVEISLRMQKRQKRKIFKPCRQSKMQNVRLVTELLQMEVA